MCLGLDNYGLVLYWTRLREFAWFSIVNTIIRDHNYHRPFWFGCVWYRLWYPSRTLRSSSDTRMLEIQQYKRKTHLLLWTPHLEFTPTRADIDTAQPCHLLKPNWKPSSSHSISILISVPSFCYSQCMCVCQYEKRKKKEEDQKALRVSNLALLSIVFKWHHGIKGINYLRPVWLGCVPIWHWLITECVTRPELTACNWRDAKRQELHNV